MTGAFGSSADFIALLEAAGAQVAALPLIRIGPPPDERALQNAVENADRFDWLIFTSAAGVEAFAHRRNQPLPQHVRIAAVGPATARVLAERLGRRADVAPERFSGSALADAIAQCARPADAMLVIAARDASPILVANLRHAGFRVEKVDAYTTLEAAPADLGARVRACDVVTLASPSAVRALVRGLGDNAAEKLRGRLLACIGPVTLQEARQRGLHVEIVPESATLPAVVEALCRYYSARS